MSIWLKLNNQRSGFPRIRWHIENEEGKEVYAYRFKPRMETDIYKNWMRLSDTLQVYSDMAKWRLNMAGQPCIIDELMIRPVAQDIYYRTADDNKRLFLNNYPINQ